MNTLSPPWPKGIPYLLTDRCRLAQSPLDGLLPHQKRDWLAESAAVRRRMVLDSFQATGYGTGYDETAFVNEADHTALASSSAEGSLLAGTNKQPIIPAGYFLKPGQYGFTLLARGVFSNTSTPTLIFQVRAGETAGSAFLSGTSLGVSAAITTASGVTNIQWELRLDMTCTVRGIGTGNATLAGAGYVASYAGFASPFVYPLQPTTPNTATWTAVFNAAVTQYINLSATWSASSASNTITCKYLRMGVYNMG